MAAALIGEPKLLVLDEPTNGLDTVTRELLIYLLNRRRNERTVVFSTHDRDFLARTGASVTELTSAS